jgi:hypothetical protein
MEAPEGRQLAVDRTDEVLLRLSLSTSIARYRLAFLLTAHA